MGDLEERLLESQNTNSRNNMRSVEPYLTAKILYHGFESGPANCHSGRELKKHYSFIFPELENLEDEQLYAYTSIKQVSVYARELC